MDDQQDPYKAPQQTGRYYRDYFWYNLAIMVLINLRSIVVGIACFIGGLVWVYASVYPEQFNAQFNMDEADCRVGLIFGPITSIFGAMLLIRAGWATRLAWQYRSKRIQTYSSE